MLILEKLKKFAKDPSRIAAVDIDGRELSYSDLESKSESIGSWLVDKYPNKEAIMIWCDKENDTLCLIFACIKSAHPFVPVASNYPAKRINQIIEECKPCVALTVGGNLFPVGVTGVELIAKDKLEAILKEYEEASIDKSKWPQREDAVCLFYTSGSTGRPKGVKIKEKNIEGYIEWRLEDGDVLEDRVNIINMIPYAFSYSLSLIIYSIGLAGSTLFAIDRNMLLDQDRLAHRIIEINPTMITGTPSFVKMLMKDKSFCYESMPNILYFNFGGEVLEKGFTREVKKRFPNAFIYNRYGATEMTISPFSVMISEELMNEIDGSMPIGTCAKNAKYYIVNSEGKCAQPGEAGELVVESPMVIDGYLNDADKTQKYFYTTQDGQMGFHTRDCVIEKNGLVYYLGRMDNMIKVGGYRVELEDVEKSLIKNPEIDSCAVVPAMKDENGMWLDGYIVLKDDVQPSLSTTIKIKKELSDIVAPYMIPQRLFYVEKLPKNASGKLDRLELINRSRIK